MQHHPSTPFVFAILHPGVANGYLVRFYSVNAFSALGQLGLRPGVKSYYLAALNIPWNGQYCTQYTGKCKYQY